MENVISNKVRTWSLVGLLALLALIIFGGAGVFGQSYNCTDSDGGKNYYVKGQYKLGWPDGSTSVNEDSCFGPTEGRPNAPAVCYSADGLHGNGKCVIEAYCGADGRQDYEIYVCPNGCGDGACLSAPATPTCTDSDGGEDYYTKGEVRYGGAVSYDSCSGDTLNEAYCTGKQDANMGVKSYLCPYSCGDGACINDNAITSVVVEMPNSFELSLGQTAVISNVAGLTIRVESIGKNPDCSGSNCPLGLFREFVVVKVHSPDGITRDYQIFDDDTVPLSGTDGVGLSLIGVGQNSVKLNIRLVNIGVGDKDIVSGTLHKGEMGVYFVGGTGLRVEISDVVFNVNGKSLARFILTLDDDTSVQVRGTLTKGESATYMLGGDEFEFGVVDIIPSDVVRFTLKKSGEDSDGGRICPKNYKPICGLDGKTYSNFCELEAYGQGASCDGTCPCPTNRVDGTLRVNEEGTYTLVGKEYKIKSSFDLSINIGFENGEYTSDTGGSFNSVFIITSGSEESKVIRLQQKYESKVFELDGRKLKLFIKDLIVEGAGSNLLTRFALFDLSGENICPTLVPPSPNACPNGKWVYQGVDENGCQRPPICQRESEEERTCRTNEDCSRLVTCPNGRTYYPLICDLDGRCTEVSFPGGSACFDEGGGGQIPPGEEVCNGCRSNGVCLNVGVRLESDGYARYCDLDESLKVQKGVGESCQNDFECKTNSCSNGACYDLQGELRETRGLLERILDWFRWLFS